mgnify:CR=1 FL=1
MTSTTPKRPNIVFAFADDWGRYASAYRQTDRAPSLNDCLDTPNFDRVAREGVLFTHAFVTAPSCTPCRSSVVSGRYFWQCELGAILQGAVWDESIPSYPLMLEAAGYHIGHTYKVWSPGRTANAPYGAQRTAYNPAGNTFSNFSQGVTAIMRDGHGVEDAKQKIYDETRQNFNAFLEARPDERPFCYWWGPTNTHRAWEKGSGKAIWGLDPEELAGRLPSFLPDVPEIREDVCDYLGECQAVDAGLGVILERLEAIGELDNTLIVVSGDHGIPGLPRGKCNLYDFGCEVALAVRWPGAIPAGRVVEDFVNLMDLAPTFMDVGGVEPPVDLAGQTLMPVLQSDRAGQVDPGRDFVVMGRERHVAAARDGRLPYPQRCIRTRDFLYIRNFEPGRWPMGDPQGLDDPATEAPPYEELEQNTFAAYPDLDASPTKAWMVHHRAEPDVQPLYELGFGKFPAEELYDLRTDPWHMQNVVADPAYQSTRQDLASRLMAELQRYDDPRVGGLDCCFEQSPFTDAWDRES